MIDKHILEIKELVSDLHCMGTYGMVELELTEIQKKFKALETKVKNLDIQNVSESQKLELQTVKNGTFFLDKKTVEQWQKDGDIDSGDKLYARVLVKQY